MSGTATRRPQAAELLGAIAGLVGLFAFGGIALADGALGPELECFPRLQGFIAWFIAPGVLGALASGAVGAALIVSSARRKARPGLLRLAPLGLAIAAFVLVSTPPYGDPIRHLFAMSPHGPGCAPGGWLGAHRPEDWARLMKRMGGPPEQGFDPHFHWTGSRAGRD